MVGLVGYTGTVGKHIAEQYHIDKCYNSKNITEIQNMEFDLLFISGIAGTKYLANQNEQEDRDKIDNLFNNLTYVSARTVVFISTIDISLDVPYGRNRLYAEQRIKQLFSNVFILRLPGLVGKHIKKNFIFDICHNKDLKYTSKNSQYEFMDLEDLHKFIDSAIFSDQHLVEIRSEPVSTYDICLALNISYDNLSNASGIQYSHFGKNAYTKDEELLFITEYVSAELQK